MPEHKPFREEWEKETGTKWRPWKWFFAVVGIGLAVYLVLLLAGALTLPFRTARGVAERVGNPDNVLYQSEHFHDLCAGVRALDVKIANKAQEIEDYAKAHPGGDKSDVYQAAPKADRLATELDGLKAMRAEQVETYNADSAKANRSLFKAGSLPYRLDESTPVCN